MMERKRLAIRGDKGRDSEVTDFLNVREKTEIPELDIEKLQRKEPDKQYLLDCRYMRMALIWAENSYSQRKQVGALIVKDKMIISDGYNGTPSGFENVCEDENGVTKPYVLHAEANAITKLAKTNNSSIGATLYVTMSPCLDCAKLIIQSGIRRVVYKEKYRITDGLDLLERVGIEVVQLDTYIDKICSDTQICTTAEQSFRLIEMGVNRETADIYHKYDYLLLEDYLGWAEKGESYTPDERNLPAWSLHRLKSICVPNIEVEGETYFLTIGFDDVVSYKSFDYMDGCERVYCSFCGGNLYSNMVDCIEWLIDNWYLKVEKE